MAKWDVKPLEWVEDKYGWGAKGVGPQAEYRIYTSAKGVFVLGGVMVEMDQTTDHHSLEAAKATAQADFEARILSHLIIGGE